MIKCVMCTFQSFHRASAGLALPIIKMAALKYANHDWGLVETRCLRHDYIQKHSVGVCSTPTRDALDPSSRYERITPRGHISIYIPISKPLKGRVT